MFKKFFPQDKNYILESVQLSLEQELLQYLVDFVKVEYLLRSNPLGLADATSTRIQEFELANIEQLKEFYLNLMAVYRYTHYHDNQLEFIFDGRDPAEKYQEEWTQAFRKYTRELALNDNFLRTVLDLTVFYPEDYTPQMAGLRLSSFISRKFELRFDPAKGIQRVKVA